MLALSSFMTSLKKCQTEYELITPVVVEDATLQELLLQFRKKERREHT